MSAQPPRSSSTVLGVMVAGLLLVALPAAAGAQSESHGVAAAPVNALGTDVSAVDQRDNRAAVAVRGTDVSAVDQRDNRAAVAVRGTDVSAARAAPAPGARAPPVARGVTPPAVPVRRPGPPPPDRAAWRAVTGGGAACLPGQHRAAPTPARKVGRGAKGEGTRLTSSHL